MILPECYICNVLYLTFLFIISPTSSALAFTTHCPGLLGKKNSLFPDFFGKKVRIRTLVRENRPSWGHWDYLGLFLDHFWTILWPFRDHFGTILKPFWDHFGTILGLFWDYFGTLLILTSGDLFWPLRTYFDTKLSMSSFAPSAIEEGAEGPQKGPKGPQPSAGARRLGA